MGARIPQPGFPSQTDSMHYKLRIAFFPTSKEIYSLIDYIYISFTRKIFPINL